MYIKLNVFCFCLMASAASVMAGAVTLPSVIDPNDAPLPIKKEAAPIPCDQILARLTNYNSMARQHDQSLTSFLSDVSDKASGWYDLLSPLEGAPQTLSVGTFAPLKDGADKISQITDLAFNNSTLLAQEMDHILTSMRACATATAPGPAPAP